MAKSKARKNVDENFKVAAVQRLQTGGVLANDLAKELGVSIWRFRGTWKLRLMRAVTVRLLGLSFILPPHAGAFL